MPSLPSKRQFCAFSAIITATFIASVGFNSAQAGNMYVYKDNNGQVLLTNVTPEGNFEKFTQRVSVTYYPDSDSPLTSSPTSSATNNNFPASYQGFSTPSNSANRNAYDGYIRASALRHGVDPALIKAMMHTESAFNPNARSPVGAQGLMQLMPATARRFSVNNAWNPAENIEGATKYIAWLTNRFNGNMEYVVAGYNAGEGNVDKYGGIPPFRETQNYVRRVLGRYNTLYRNDAGLMAGSTHTDSNNNSYHSASGTMGTSGSYTIQRASYPSSSYSSSSTNSTYGTSSNYAQSAYSALR